MLASTSSPNEWGVNVAFWPTKIATCPRNDGAACVDAQTSTGAMDSPDGRGGDLTIKRTGEGAGGGVETAGSPGSDEGGGSGSGAGAAAAMCAASAIGSTGG